MYMLTCTARVAADEAGPIISLYTPPPNMRIKIGLPQTAIYSDRPPSQPRPQKSPVFAGVAVRGGRSLSPPGCIDSYGRLDFGKYLTLVFFPISKNLKKAECASTIRWGSLGHAL